MRTESLIDEVNTHERKQIDLIFMYCHLFISLTRFVQTDSSTFHFSLFPHVSFHQRYCSNTVHKLMLSFASQILKMLINELFSSPTQLFICKRSVSLPEQSRCSCQIGTLRASLCFQGQFGEFFFSLCYALSKYSQGIFGVLFCSLIVPIHRL